MLTGFQASTGAYVTEDGELLCPSCFNDGDTLARPVSNYGLDEWQSEDATGYEWDDDDGLDHSECEPALFDANYHELRAEYHYHAADQEDPKAIMTDQEYADVRVALGMDP